jgi:3-oxoadipate enol-lactonase
MTCDSARPKQAVLVLSGIGLTAGVAARTIASLRPHLNVVVAPHTRAITSADEAVALLDSANTDGAHVVGLSFGAAVAQELAIRYPERVRSLVLGSSTAGGRLYIPPDRTTRQFIRRLSDLPAEEGLWAAVPYLYADTTYRGCAPRIGEDIAQRLTGDLDPHAYRRQHAIARAHDTSGRSDEITAPTLVVHGEHDRVMPLENGRLLASAIPGAEFMALPTGAHAFPTDVPDANLEIVKFLRAN